MRQAFFVTCGRGMDYFVVKELSGISQIHSMESTDGKVFFQVLEREVSSSPRFAFLWKLKSVERLFVTICKKESGRNCMEDLMNELSAWNGAYDTWAALQNAMLDSDEEPPHKKVKSENGISKITYRISCKCAGNVARKFSIHNTSKLLSEAIEQYLGWQHNLKDPLLEIYVHLNDTFTVIGLPVCKNPLSKRPYLKSIKLRSTVCWAMACSASIKCGDLVLDPMCGAGTVVIEVLKSWPVSTIIGVDSSREQLQRAIENCDFADVLGKTNLIQGTVEALPVKSEFADVVLCDFPFGLKHGTIETVKTLLPKSLQEMNRVCRVDGRIVILISQQLVEHLCGLISELFPRKASGPLVPVKCRAAPGTDPSSAGTRGTTPTSAVFWKQQSKNYVKLGDLGAYICTFSKKR